MAFQSKDGKRKFGSGFQAKRYDAARESEAEPKDEKEESRTNAMGMSKKSQPSVGALGTQKGMHEAEGSPEDHDATAESRSEADGETKAPEEVVAEHGKAHSTHIHSDHNAGRHHVVSHHEDGHMHTSDHGTSEEANEHAKKLAGEPEPNMGGETQGADEGAGSLASLFTGGQ